MFDPQLYGQCFIFRMAHIIFSEHIHHLFSMIHIAPLSAHCAENVLPFRFIKISFIIMISNTRLVALITVNS